MASVAVSLVSDMSIALDEKVLFLFYVVVVFYLFVYFVKMTPYCDTLMMVLLQNLQSSELDRDIKVGTNGVVACFVF